MFLTLHYSCHPCYLPISFPCPSPSLLGGNSSLFRLSMSYLPLSHAISCRSVPCPLSHTTVHHLRQHDELCYGTVDGLRLIDTLNRKNNSADSAGQAVGWHCEGSCHYSRPIGFQVNAGTQRECKYTQTSVFLTSVTCRQQHCGPLTQQVMNLKVHKLVN